MKVETRGGPGHPVAEHEAHRFLDADPTARNAQISKAPGDQRVRVLVLVPGEHGRGRVEGPHRDLFPGAILLEGLEGDQPPAEQQYRQSS